jgi:hypothetical protein
MMHLIVAQWDLIFFQNFADLLQIISLASWDDGIHRGTMVSAFFLLFFSPIFV